MPALVLIAAIAENGVIGSTTSSHLPWGMDLPRDMARFKKATKHIGTVVMGRKTALTLVKPLPGRRNIVLSRTAESWAGFDVIRSLRDLNDRFEPAQTVAVIGGAEIYRLAAPYAASALLTRVHQDFEGDVLFPVDALLAYERVGAVQSFPCDENDKYPTSFFSARNTKRISL